jgi:hypothetical protein
MSRTVLFSRTDVADFLQQHFEPAWESVRPVPLVRFDFGDGRVVTRTLHGNIASHVCVPDGQVLDILPGLYTPPVYRSALDRLRQLAASVDWANAGQRLTQLRQYHQGRALLLRNPGLAQAAEAAARQADRGKGRIELPVERLVGNRGIGVIANPPNGPGGRPVRIPRPEAPPAPGTDAALWALLAADTRLNQTERRRQIHERLAASGSVRPAQIKNWLYREVLHADLEDPYLGLGHILFRDTLFPEETT